MRLPTARLSFVTNRINVKSLLGSRSASRSETISGIAIWSVGSNSCHALSVGADCKNSRTGIDSGLIRPKFFDLGIEFKISFYLSADTLEGNMKTTSVCHPILKGVCPVINLSNRKSREITRFWLIFNNFCSKSRILRNLRVVETMNPFFVS